MPNSDDEPDWLQLLSSLSDEELHRYGEIAADQRRLEWGYAWAQIACAIASIITFGWVVRECAIHGLSWRAGAVLGLALALGYWPYRKALVRRLWTRHCSAVKREEVLRHRAVSKTEDKDQS